MLNLHTCTKVNTFTNLKILLFSPFFDRKMKTPRLLLLHSNTPPTKAFTACLKGCMRCLNYFLRE